MFHLCMCEAQDLTPALTKGGKNRRGVGEERREEGRDIRWFQAPYKVIRYLRGDLFFSF